MVQYISGVPIPTTVAMGSNSYRNEYVKVTKKIVRPSQIKSYRLGERATPRQRSQSRYAKSF